MGTCQSTEGSVHLSPASKHEKSVVFAIHEPDSHESDKTSTTVKIPESEQPISTPAPDPLVTNGTAKTSPELPPKASGPVGGATAALEAAMASGGGAPAYPPPTPLPNPMMGGATAALTAAADERSDVSSIGSNGSGIGSVGGGGLSTSHRSNGNMHRSRLSLGNSSSVIGLDSMIESRREEGGLTANVVHMEVPFGKPIEEVYDGIQTGPVLGSGISGVVRLVTHKATGVKYAVKCLDLGLVDTEEGLMQLREEIFIMCQLDHPNIVRLEEVYESHKEIYLVQELCVGGELYDRLDEQPDYHYTEAECARLIKQMLCAVRYLHSKGIIHRDLKLENFLFSSRAADSELKMIDFGLSKHFRYGEVQHEAVGTPYTVAPEVIRGQYDERCDIWAIGVIAFLLFSGDPPFGGCGGPEPLMVLRQNILDGNFQFEPGDIWDLVSDLGKVFVQDLLVTDPQKRPTAREAQKHPWLKLQASRASNGERQDNVLNPNVVKALIGFKEFSDMRKLLSEVLSFTLLPDQIKDLRKEFEIMDSDGTGEITLDNLKQVLVSNAEAGSLGALTEEEVVDIFNAMRVNKEETTIHWHEFIAAGLTQCRVDDRNLRLAFDRLDGDHKGYITLNDIVNLVGSDDMASEQEMRDMWTESMNNVGGTQQHITYDRFLLIMKGQTEKAVLQHHIDLNLRPMHLDSVPEQEDDAVVAKGTEIDSEAATKTTNPKVDFVMPLPSTNGNTKSLVPKTGSDISKDKDRSHFLLTTSNHSLPNMKADAMYSDSERSMSTIESNVDSSLTSTPATPNDGVASVSAKTIKSIDADKAKVFVAKKPGIITRQRSKSLETEPVLYVRQDSSFADTMESSPNPNKASLGVDTRRALNLPERNDGVQDELANKSALAVNRELYRAHRRMRISVLDASRHFEEKQAIRARDTLMKKQVKEAMGAGLVMRHGTKLQVTSEAIRKYLDETMAEQQVLLEKANRRGGRGRRTRKKTISDMSAMMSPSMGQEEMGEIAALAAFSSTPDSKRSTFHHTDFDGVEGLPDLSTREAKESSSPGNNKLTLAPRITAAHTRNGGLQRRHSGHRMTVNVENEPTSTAIDQGVPAATPNLPQIDHKSLRRPTVPGQFLKTEDPFGAAGMYRKE
mmetsp:Transcript_57303/g.116658  ORF Transcript_57303/g.116658 Transcript_57303/m.116658 type:complete len:1133 (+) Transcript_57303:288-3686(+)